MPEDDKTELWSWRRDIGARKEFHEQRLWGFRDARSDTVKYVDRSERLRIKGILFRAYREGLVEIVGPGVWQFP